LSSMYLSIRAPGGRAQTAQIGRVTDMLVRACAADYWLGRTESGRTWWSIRVNAGQESLEDKRSQWNGSVCDSACPSCLPDAWAVIALPHIERSSQMLRCGDSFGAEGREPLILSKFRHSKPNQAHGQDQDGFGKFHKTPAKFATALGRPVPGERATSGGDHALAEAHEVEVGGGEFIRRDQAGESAPVLGGQHVAQEMIVDDNLTHVVARSGSSARDETNAAWSSRLRRSPIVSAPLQRGP
jgi:hypothetical protein